MEQTTPVGLNFVDKESPVLRLGEEMSLEKAVKVSGRCFSKQFGHE